MLIELNRTMMKREGAWNMVLWRYYKRLFTDTLKL
ncbi:hypothetical protein BJQ97_00393 [Geobacillus sp. TFV-3]|nr:hypothetical protein BJQ97_00393 [Geobacillus sp. TFV-3]